MQEFRVHCLTSKEEPMGAAMPVPSEYQRANDNFYEFLMDARDAAGLGSTRQAYTMVQGVLLEKYESDHDY
jgi:hypothetical protein